jgi:hypothetical protein
MSKVARRPSMGKESEVTFKTHIVMTEDEARRFRDGESCSLAEASKAAREIADEDNTRCYVLEVVRIVNPTRGKEQE